ncbi:MAG: hypothetical protein OHK0039_35770 [Bacteroidia bacterium]
MTAWIEIAPPDGPDGTIRELRLHGKRICLVRCAGVWYAVGARCPHAGGPLAAGFVNDRCQVVCPWHRFGFDLHTGESASGGYFIPTYPLRNEDGRCWIGMPRRPWWRRG